LPNKSGMKANSGRLTRPIFIKAGIELKA